MRTPLEALERSLLKQAPLLVGRALDEAEGPKTVALVERIVRVTGENVEVVYASTQWQRFETLYPVAAARIKKESSDR